MKNRTKVLVVDDDRRMVKTLCDILKVKGYEATEAYSGGEAVDRIRTCNQDCVLMDIKMPGINGVEALFVIREICPDLPVVLMSAYADGKQIDMAKGKGAYSVMTKPVDIQSLLSFLSLIRKEESILLVDDDKNFSRTLSDILTLRGYIVETESEPERVLGHLEQTYKLTVLLDLKLGNRDGIDILKDIRKKYPTKPVVLITAYREKMKASIEQGLHIGAYSCLYKPFVTEELIEVIEAIRLKKLQQILGELAGSGIA